MKGMISKVRYACLGTGEKTMVVIPGLSQHDKDDKDDDNDK